MDTFLNEIVQNRSVQDSTQEPARKAWDEGNWFALALGIGLTIFWGPLLGFYMGTVFGSAHVNDLQHADILNGLKGAGIGFVVGLIALITILVMYPSRTKQDVEDWTEEFSHPHFDKGH